MFNRLFMEQVRQQLIRVLAEQARAAKGALLQQKPAAGPVEKYSDTDAAAFVDLQNLHNFLKHNCRVEATQVHILNMLKEFASANRMPLVDIFVCSGIHDRAREPQRWDAMNKRRRWLEREGARVTLLPLSYYTDATGVRSQEKGVDVRIASEILRAVNQGLQRAFIVSQDKDIAQAVEVAQEMARERGRTFQAYTMALEDTQWAHNGKCGMNGLRGTVRLPISVEMIARHVRPPRAESGDESGKLEGRGEQAGQAAEA
ncbi:uncharacterized LabA/DUF88 family protein [Roseateles asaccharophilus]|uniref:NYN domain-containing protein n=1 Tax=Roseateles asaccharophilus TaxID=582607 RepID=UPI003837AE18